MAWNKLGLAAGAAWIFLTGSSWATECCVLNPNLRLYAQSPECTTQGTVERCGPIEKVVGNKVGLLEFLGEEVGAAFPRNAFIYLCPIDIDDPAPPVSGMSFVRTKDMQVNVDVTPYLKFQADFAELIWQGSYDASNGAERTKDMFPMAVQINGTQGGVTNIRLIGLAQENYNSRGIDDNGMEKIAANVRASVVGDPGNDNTFQDIPVLVDGRSICVTRETFDRN